MTESGLRTSPIEVEHPPIVHLSHPHLSHPHLSHPHLSHRPPLSPTLLLTSFRPWSAHQTRNASDDLLLALRNRSPDPLNQTGLTLQFLHRLPVYTVLAYEQILQAQQEVQADFIICCGVAESRQVLSLEAQAQLGSSRYLTPLPLAQLQAGLSHTEISHDAGQFVCNGLYYGLLAHFALMPPSTTRAQAPHSPQVGFLHVPPLTNSNLPDLLVDLLEILRRLGALFSG